MIETLVSSHSTDVEMWLDCGEHGCVFLSRITPKSVVAKTYQEIPPGFVDLVVLVDDQYLSKRVYLPTGFSKGRRVARISVADDSSPF